MKKIFRMKKVYVFVLSDVKRMMSTKESDKWTLQAV